MARDDEPLPLWWRAFAWLWLRVSVGVVTCGAVVLGTVILMLAFRFLPRSLQPYAILASMVVAPAAFLAGKRALEHWYARKRRELAGVDAPQLEANATSATTPVAVSSTTRERA